MTNYDSDNKSNIDYFYSIINYIIQNYQKFALLILVFIIIYIVDYICVINSSLYATPSPIPGVATAPKSNIKIKTNKKNKRNK